MKYFLFSLITVFVVAILGLGYFGILGPISKLLRTDKPRDLGVQYSQQEFDSYLQKTESSLSVVSQETAPANNYKFEEPRDYDIPFSQEEISARIEYDPWIYKPISNVQVQFNDGGIVEATGVLDIATGKDFLRILGYSEEIIQQAEQGLKYVEMLVATPPFYIKGEAEINNNVANINIQRVELGRINLPIARVDTNGIAAELAHRAFSKVDGLNIEKVTFDEGVMNFVGQSPSKVTLYE